MRIGFTLFALVTIFFLPYWIYLPVLALGIILFPLYLEVIVLSLLVDTIYGSPGAPLFGYPFGIISALLVLFAAPLREHLRFNNA